MQIQMRATAILVSILILNTLVNLSSRYHTEKRIQAVEAKLSKQDAAIQQYLKDPEAWQRAKNQLK